LLFVKVAETYLRESAVSICVNLREKRGLGEGGTWGLGERTKCKEPKLKKNVCCLWFVA